VRSPLTRLLLPLTDPLLPHFPLLPALPASLHLRTPSKHPHSMTITVVSHPVSQSKLSQLRDARSSSAQFRQLLKEISTIVGLEASKELPLTEVPSVSRLPSSAYCCGRSARGGRGGGDKNDGRTSSAGASGRTKMCSPCRSTVACTVPFPQNEASSSSPFLPPLPPRSSLLCHPTQHFRFLFTRNSF
jgi:hypothetical protein